MQPPTSRTITCHKCLAVEHRTFKFTADHPSGKITYELNQFNETVRGLICAKCRRAKKNTASRARWAKRPKARKPQIGDVKEFTCPGCNKTEARTLAEVRRVKKANYYMWLRPGGYLANEIKCYPCIAKRNIECRTRKITANTFSKAKPYIKTPKGHIVVKYACIRARCLGIDKKNPHIYEGLPFEKKEPFYEWALNHPTFKKLFKAYQESGYRRRLAPSVDRIDTTKGYTFDNMQWLPNHENASRGMLQRWAMYRRGNKSVFGENRNLRK